ncbi:DUF6153 family protein [Nocardioides marmoraquaticus]
MTIMTTTDRRGRGNRARLAVVVLGLLLGLLGMHALSMHGANAAPDANQAADHGTHTASHAPDTAALADASAEAADKAPRAATAGGGHDGGMSGHGGHNSGAMLMICLAVLAVALSLLWPALARGLGYVTLPRLTLTRIAPIRSLRLGTGPPSVWQFSVIRC